MKKHLQQTNNNAINDKTNNKPTTNSNVVFGLFEDHVIDHGNDKMTKTMTTTTMTTMTKTFRTMSIIK